MRRSGIVRQPTPVPRKRRSSTCRSAILDDHDLTNQVESYIRQNLAAEKAFDVVLHEWRARFAHHASPMMRERVGDLTDVHIRLLSLLLGLPDHDPVEVPKGAKAILVTHDLTPSLTVQLDREAIAGIATDAGTRTSHVAILARSLGLPAVVGLRDAIQRLTGGEHVVLDGSTGTLVINPTDAEVAVFHHRAEREARDEAELRLLVYRGAGDDRRRAHHVARKRRSPRGVRRSPPRAARKAWDSCAPSSSSSAARRCLTRRSSIAPIAA